MGLKRQTPETAIKSAVRKLLDQCGIFNWPVTQGIGSYRGAPDRVAHHKGRIVYLEVKTPSGALSDHQKKFQVQCQRDGIEYHVVRDVDDLIDIFNLPIIRL